MAATQDELPTGNVAKLVNRLSKDLSKEIVFRKPGSVTTTRIATVRFSYDAAQDDELTLKVDDVIDVLEDAEAGWMKGKLRGTGQIGLFPTNFVHFSESHSVGKNGVAKVETKKKIADSASEESPEAIQRSSVTDVSKGRPATMFTSALTAKKGEHEGDSEVSSVKEMAKVLYLYTPNHNDELALTEIGALVTVVSKTCADPGWFLGEIDGKKGLIPDNFVEFIKLPVTAPENKKSSSQVASLPSVPAKPAGLVTSNAVSGTAKQSGITPAAGKGSGSTTSAAGIRGGSRVLNPEFATTLAGVLNKQPKSFGLKPALKSEEVSAETRTEGPLEHITASRPKQPNKRPPSTVLNKRKSTDILMDTTITESSEPEATPFLTRAAIPSSAGSFTMETIFSASTSSPQVSSVVKNEKGDSEYVSYAEFQRLTEKFQEFRNEMLSKIAQLEAKVASLK